MSRSNPRPSGLLRIGAVGAVAAAVVNVVLYGIARAAGASFVVTDTTSVGVVDVIALTLVWFAIGLVAAGAAARWGGRRAIRILQVVGAVVAVLSMWSDFALHGAVAPEITLALMHLVVGFVYVASLELYRRAASRAMVAGPTAEAGSNLVGRS